MIEFELGDKFEVGERFYFPKQKDHLFERYWGLFGRITKSEHNVCTFTLDNGEQNTCFNWRLQKIQKEVVATKFVQVKFDVTNALYGLQKLYDFKTDLDLKPKDKVVVDANNMLSVATVEKVGIESSKATKWVVSKVDMEKHLSRIETDKKLKELKAKMEGRRKKLQELVVYEVLAKEDVEMANLLTEFNRISMNNSYN